MWNERVYERMKHRAYTHIFLLGYLQKVIKRPVEEANRNHTGAMLTRNNQAVRRVVEL